METDARLVRRLVREFDRLPPMPAGTIACPYDDGSAIRASIAYADRRRVTILVDLRGCMSVTNGNLERTAFGFGSPRQYGPQLVADLERLTRLRVGA